MMTLIDANFWSGIGQNLFVGIIGPVLFAGWYLIFFRSVEREWVCRNGLLYYIYFRNIDGRCCAISEFLGEIDFTEISDRNNLRKLYVKLKADLDGFDRISEMWADRAARFPGWFPYSKLVNKLLDVSVDLSVVLHRHIDPVLSLTEDLFEMDLSSNNISKEFYRYSRYFANHPEVIWALGTDSLPSSIVHSTELDRICELQNMQLNERLEKVLSQLRILVEEKGGLKFKNISLATPEWDLQGNPDSVWFNAV